jgi:hypothetical protein
MWVFVWLAELVNLIRGVGFLTLKKNSKQVSLHFPWKTPELWTIDVFCSQLVVDKINALFKFEQFSKNRPNK